MNLNLSTKIKGVLSRRIVRRAAFAIPAGFAIVGGASADSVLNTTQITGIFGDLTAIFPAIGNFVVSVLPTLIILGIVGFVLGFFDKILAIFDKVL